MLYLSQIPKTVHDFENCNRFKDLYCEVYLALLLVGNVRPEYNGLLVYYFTILLCYFLETRHMEKKLFCHIFGLKQQFFVEILKRNLILNGWKCK